MAAKKKPARKKAAPKKQPVGRPTQYKPEYCDELINYCNTHKPLPTVVGFAASVGVSKETLRNWKNSYPEFLAAFKKAKIIMETKWIEGSLNGDFQTAFSIFLGKNVFGWKDKQDHTHGDPDGNPLKININWGKSDD